MLITIVNANATSIVFLIYSILSFTSHKDWYFIENFYDSYIYVSLLLQHILLEIVICSFSYKFL